MKIFILEDDPERIASFAMSFLRDSSNEVHWAHSTGRLDAFKGGYDLIFLDHDLGGVQHSEHNWECVDDGECTEWCVDCGAIQQGRRHGNPGSNLRYPEHSDTGLVFLRRVKDRIDDYCTVIIHSHNPDGAKAMLAEYPAALLMPFGGSQFRSFIVGMLYGKT